MKSNQVRLVTAAVFRDGQQFSHALEPGLTREVVRDATDGDRLNRIHDDMPVVHPVPTTHLDMGLHPDANRATDSALSDALAKALGEQHRILSVGRGLNREHATVFLSSRMFLRPPARRLPQGSVMGPASRRSQRSGAGTCDVDQENDPVVRSSKDRPCEPARSPTAKDVSCIAAR